MVEKIGENWEAIANELQMRDSEEIKLRYKEKLDPSVKKVKFNMEEDAMLLKLQAEIGNNWEEISNRLKENKGAKRIRNRYYTLKHHKSQDKIVNIHENLEAINSNNIHNTINSSVLSTNSITQKTQSGILLRSAPNLQSPDYDNNNNLVNLNSLNYDCDKNDCFSDSKEVNSVTDNFDVEMENAFYNSNNIYSDMINLADNINEEQNHMYNLIDHEPSEPQNHPELSHTNNFKESYNNIFKENELIKNEENYEKIDVNNVLYQSSNPDINYDMQKNQQINQTKSSNLTSDISKGTYLDLNNIQDRNIYEKFNTIKQNFMIINEAKNDYIKNQNLDYISKLLFFKNFIDNSNTDDKEYLQIISQLEFFKNKIILLQSITNEGSQIIKESLINQVEIFIQLIKLTKLQISMLCQRNNKN